MEKRILKGTLILLLMAICIIGTSLSASATVVKHSAGGLTYSFNTSTGTIVKCEKNTNSDINTVKIPGKINGVTVKRIGGEVFSDIHGVSKFVLPDSITSIGDFAFPTNVYVNIPKKLETIGTMGFYACRTKNLTLPKSLKKIGEESLNLNGKYDSIFIPKNVSYIGKNALPDGVKSIKVSSYNKKYASKNGALFNKKKTKIIAYPYGKKTKKYIIPGTVTEIDAEVFSNCQKKLTLVIPSKVKKIYRPNYFNGHIMTKVSSKNKHYSSKNGVLFNKSKTKLIYYPTFAGSKSYTVPDSVKTIGEYAMDCTDMKSLNIPSSVKTIEENGIFYFMSYGPVIYCKSSSAAGRWFKKNSIPYTSKLKKPTLKAKNLGGKTIKLSWSKVEGKTKYQVDYYNANKGKYEIIHTTSDNSVKLQINKKSTVKFKVRAYREIGKNKIYSPYSSVKKI